LNLFSLLLSIGDDKITSSMIIDVVLKHNVLKHMISLAITSYGWLINTLESPYKKS